MKKFLELALGIGAWFMLVFTIASGAYAAEDFHDWLKERREAKKKEKELIETVEA